MGLVGEGRGGGVGGEEDVGMVGGAGMGGTV